MYKDSDRQREANRQAQAKFKAKGITQGITDTKRVIPNQGVTEAISGQRQADEGYGSPTSADYKPERTAQGNIRVSKPGDADYVPMCETTKALLDGKPKITNVLKFIGIQPDKRGKDIKHFGDLPMDVQRSIDRLSDTPEEKAKRTKAAIKYERQFPDRFHGTGVN